MTKQNKAASAVVTSKFNRVNSSAGGGGVVAAGSGHVALHLDPAFAQAQPHVLPPRPPRKARLRRGVGEARPFGGVRQRGNRRFVPLRPPNHACDDEPPPPLMSFSPGRFPPPGPLALGPYPSPTATIPAPTPFPSPPLPPPEAPPPEARAAGLGAARVTKHKKLSLVHNTRTHSTARFCVIS